MILSVSGYSLIESGKGLGFDMEMKSKSFECESSGDKEVNS